MTPFEYEDYRKKGPPPSFTEWTPVKPVRYCMGQTFCLFILPFLFGFSFSEVVVLLYRHEHLQNQKSQNILLIINLLNV